MRKTSLIVAIAFMLLFVGCSPISKAQKQFDKGNYKEVIALLEGKTDEKSAELYDLANFKIFETDIASAIKNADCDLMVKTIINYNDLYKDSDILDQLEEAFLTEIKNLLSDNPQYDDFKYIENVFSDLKSKEYKGNLISGIEKTLSERKLDKLKVALTGTWTRKDNTGLNGSKIEIIFSENSGKAILKYAVDNPYGFVNGDIKWKDIELYSENNFSFNDLSKSIFEASYKPANATIDYNNMTISIHVSDAYTDGTDQSWVKDEYIDVANNQNTNVSSADYLYPSDTQYITESELAKYDKDKVALIRNEIYARHGYVFKTEPFKSYFSSKSWYVANDNFNESMLNEIELANKDLIISYEEKQGWR